ncbi:hypothetical protein [uncultured Vagococcus sp.]|uniref:hypothetical protein n=1 Tax=uncultured Vagococcus sp. TaxID=189676 RepID=UPI0028D69308|nr:hypothetical protein [uncultured Vagococcus sp.]
MKFLYISCLDIFFETDEELSYEERQCEQCGDEDRLVGMFITDSDRKKLESDYLSGR